LDRSEAETERADKLSEQLGSLSSLNVAFEPILGVILISLDAAAVFMRTKGLRSLGQILTSDHTVLKKVGGPCSIRLGLLSQIVQTNVRKAIEEHLLDNSAAVRDAAVELIGKHLLQSPEVAGDYYEKIVDRILVGFHVHPKSYANLFQDTGLGVRKRVIKLLKVFYTSTTDVSRRVDVSSRIVHRMLDEDDGVKVRLIQ
jgi:cohesin loading factor subunit SCC2